MKFLDKVKNMFTEEVEDEVKVEPIKREVTHVEIESPNVEEKIENENSSKNYIFEAESKEKLKKPVFFDDNDFEDLKLNDSVRTVEKIEYPSKVELEKKLYNTKDELEERKVFKPTPIISPVYGVLDKNYHKEDIVSKNEIKYEDIDLEPSIDSIRNKAYGTLEDELENTLFGKNSILFRKDNIEKTNEDNNEVVENINEITDLQEDLLDSFTEDISKELDELLVKKEKYLDNEILKKEDKENIEEDDLLGFIDSTLYKDEEE